MQPTPFSANALLKGLETAGLRLFATAIYGNVELMNILNHNDIQLIMGPSDTAITEFLNQTGHSIGDLSSMQIGRNIIANHFSLNYSNTESTYFSISEQQIDISKAAITSYRTSSKIYIGTTIVAIIGVIITTPEQRLKWAAPRTAGLKSAFGGGQVGNESLRILIAKGGIKGRDLIALCNTNFEVNDFCDSRDLNGNTMFHRAMMAEFNVELFQDEDARELYIHYHNAAYTYFIHSAGDTQLGPVKAFRVSENLHIDSQQNENYYYCITLNGELEIFEIYPVENPQIRVEHMVRQIDIDEVTGIPVGMTFTRFFSGMHLLGRNGVLYHKATMLGGHQFYPIISPPEKVVSENGEVYLLYNSDTRTKRPFSGNSRLNIHFPIIPDDTVGLSVQKFLLRKGDVPRQYSVIEDFSLDNPFTIDLATIFPGGPFLCNLNKVQYVHTEMAIVSIVNDLGELWICWDLRNHPETWIKLNSPRIGKIIEYSMWVESGEIDYRMHIPIAIGQVRPPPTKFYNFYSKTLDDRGQVFKFDKHPTTSEIRTEVYYQIPDLASIPNEFPRVPTGLIRIKPGKFLFDQV